eukprot:9401049-Pyramimonas_sp.AAC.1
MRGEFPAARTIRRCRHSLGIRADPPNAATVCQPSNGLSGVLFGLSEVVKGPHVGDKMALHNMAGTSCHGRPGHGRKTR